MTDRERSAIRERLLSFMEKVSAPMKSPYQPTMSPFVIRATFPLKMMHVAKVMALVLIVMLATGGTLTYASQSALPGDTLYPVKIQAEDIAGALKGSHEEKVAWLSTRMDRRITEIQTLKAENKLTPETEKIVTTAFEDHAKAIDEDISALVENGKSEVVVAIANDLLPKLDNYEKVVDQTETVSTVIVETSIESDPTLEPIENTSTSINATVEGDSLAPVVAKMSGTPTLLSTDSSTGSDSSSIITSDLVNTDAVLPSTEATSSDIALEATTITATETSPLVDLIRKQRSVLIAKKESSLKDISESAEVSGAVEGVQIDASDPSVDADTSLSPVGEKGRLIGHVRIAGAVYNCLQDTESVGTPSVCALSDRTILSGRSVLIYDKDTAELVETVSLPVYGNKFDISLPPGSYTVAFSGLTDDRTKTTVQEIVIVAGETSEYNVDVTPEGYSSTNSATGIVSGKIIFPTGSTNFSSKSIAVSNAYGTKIRSLSIKKDGTFTTSLSAGTYTFTLQNSAGAETSSEYLFSAPITLSVEAHGEQNIEFTVSGVTDAALPTVSTVQISL